MDRFFEEFSHTTRQFPRFLNSHHTAPLTYYPQKLVLDAFDGDRDALKTPAVRKAYDQLISLKSRDKERLSVNLNFSVFLHFCLQQCTNTDINVSTSLKRSLQVAIQVMINLSHSEIKGIEAQHPYMGEVLSSQLLKLADHTKILDAVLPCYSILEFLTSVRNEIQFKACRKDYSYKERRFSSIWMCISGGDIIIFKNIAQPSKLTLMNYDQLLMILDTVSARTATRLTCCVSDILQTEPLPTWEIIKKIYSWGDIIINRYGAKGLSIIGAFEDLVTTMFVNFPGSDPIQLGAQHTDCMFEKAQETFDQYGVAAFHTEEIITILKEVKCPNQLSEIFGLRKHWGNPIVDAAASGAAVQEKLNEILPITAEGLLRLKASFHRMFTLEYIKKHGSWPECEFPKSLQDCPLSIAQRSRSTRVPELDINHRHEHWAELKFLPMYTLDKYKNPLKLVSDKSVSLPRSKLDHIYERSRQKKALQGTVSEQRRLILEFLRKDQMPILDIFATVMTGCIPDEWLANSSAMKGTEMKYEKARIFAVLVYEMRQYFAASEEIIKEGIFPYNPHQTMTMNEVSLLSRLRDVTSQMDPDSTTRFIHLIHIIDFSKWNLRMRYGNTSGIFKSVDDILGTPGLIEMSHLIFAAMLNLVQDRYNPPEDGVLNTESDTVWTVHTRGWEGQRQKGWTVLTSALLSDMERITGIHSEICGQGDNQVLLTKFKIPDEYMNPDDWIKRSPQQIRKVFDDFYAKLEQICLSVGLKIKTGESCRSLAYMNYGKRLYFLGNELSMMMKRLSKLTTEPNDTVPTTESLLKTMNASGTAVNIYSHPSIVPVLIGNFFNCMQLQTAFNNNQLIGSHGIQYLQSRGLSLNAKFLTTLMEIPPTLGGVPAQSILSNLFRGHPDSGSEDFCILTTRSQGGDETAKRILLLARDKSIYNEINPEKNKESLIFAPYSLNLKIPMSATSPINNVVEEALSSYCKNNLVKGLFSSRLSLDSESVLKWLSGMKPYHPLIANDIFSRSVPGRRKTFAAGLSNATSLTRLLQVDENNSILDEVLNLERSQIEWWVELVEKVASMSQVDVQTSVIESHHNEIQKARELSWGCEIVGVTTPFASEQFALTGTDHACCSENCEKFLPEHIVLVFMSEDLVSVYGPPTESIQLNRMRGHTPYMGNTVSEGIMNRQIVCLTPDESFFDAVRLNTLQKWISSNNTQLSDGLEKLIASRTNVPKTIIDQATGTPSRLSHNHRAGLMSAKKTCAPSSTTNILSRISISSNLMGRFSHGENNYAMPYGPAFLVAQSLIALKKTYCGQSHIQNFREVIHFHVRSDDVPIVYDGKLDTERRLSLMGSNVNNPYFSSSDDVQLSRGRVSVLSHIWRDYFGVSLEHSKLAYATQLIGNSVVEEVSVRERISLSIRSEFVKRDTVISVGDLRMIGVKCLVRALALQVTLMMPYRVLSLKTQAEFLPSVHAILGNFSEGFWSQFTKVFINPRLVNSLITLAKSALHPFSTRSHVYLNGILRTAISEDMWVLRCAVLESITYGANDSSWFLIAPTDMSARYLFSKWVEVHILIGSIFSPKRNIEICALARDFSHNILATPVENLSTVIAVTQDDFRRIFSDVVDREISLPNPVFLRLGDPWVDKLRNISPPIMISAQQMEQKIPVIITQNPNVVTLSNPEGLLVEMPANPCNCLISHSQLPFRSELFFMPSGLLSKSHYRFLDVLLPKTTSFKSVICLGTSTASEAAAFSRMTVNERIYVNCMNDLRKFSPHAAATYTPSAFAIEGNPSKLIMTTESTLASNDLLTDSCVSAILRHTSGYEWCGVTCDAELDFGSGLEDRITLLRNVIKISTLRVKVGGWLCIKLPVYCCHELEKLLTLIGRHFANSFAERSYFTNHNHQIVMLSGTGLRSNMMSSLSTETILASIPDTSGTNLFPIETNRIKPLLCSAPNNIFQERLSLKSYMDDSIAVCRSLYLKGWSDMINVTRNNRAEVLESLSSYKNSMLSCIPEILYTNNRVFQNERIPRSNMLIISQGSMVSQIQDILNCVYRAELLLDIIKDESVGFNQILEKITRWMSQEKFYTINRCNIKVDLNATKFVQHFSRYLFEIVGTFFEFRYHDDDDVLPISTSLHMTEIDRNRVLYGVHLPVELLRVNHPQRVNLQWNWPRRSQLLFCLMSVLALSSDVICDIKFSHTIQDLHGRHPELGMMRMQAHPSEAANVISYEGADLAGFYQKKIEYPCAVFINIQVIDEIYANFRVLNSFKVPWSGRVPNMVALILLGELQTESNAITSFYPDFNELNHRFFEEGLSLINCGCYDCASEVRVLKQFNISSSTVNRVCSVGKIRSVRDLRHNRN